MSTPTVPVIDYHKANAAGSLLPNSSNELLALTSLKGEFLALQRP